jgi:uncharacterized membrane protein YhaH (DUF805 family)
MDPLALFTSSQGRLTPKPFWLSLLAVYAASFASQFLLTGAVTARSGLWPFAIVQAAILWAWTVVHIKRLRDAGRPPAGAIGVALLYGLSIALVLLLILAVDSGSRPVPGGQEAPAHSLLAFAVLIGLLVFLFDPNLGPFTMIFKVLALIACLPFLISLTFSLYTGLRRRVP